MLNETLLATYCHGENIADTLSVDINSPKTILSQLTNAKVRYTWETVRDERIDNQQSVIEVRVYLSGNILYGRYVYKTADASDAHLYAINNAIKTIVPQKVNVEIEEPLPFVPEIPCTPTVAQTQKTQTPMSQEDILNMLQQAQPTIPQPITTAEQFENDSREEIPFEDINLSPSELDNLLSGTIKSNNTPQPTAPVSQGFTQEQINAINEFKQRLNITNDAMLGNYINSWDNKYSNKKDLTPANIDSFIEWTKSVGKAPC